MSNTNKGTEEPTTITEAFYKYAMPWEMVDNFKVNKWMLKIGAKWVMPDPNRNFVGEWHLYDMVINQEQACKWYLATHSKPWWRFW